MLEPCNSNESILHVTGLRVDSIKTIVPLWSAPRPMVFDELSCNEATNLEKSLMTCMDLVNKTKISPDDWTWMDALFRTWVMNTTSPSNGMYPVETIGTDCLAFINHLTAIIEHRHDGTALNVIEISEEATRYASAFFEATRGRSLFFTEEGRFGLCNAAAESGDEVAIWFNCTYPVIQRVLPGSGGCGFSEDWKSTNLSNHLAANVIADVDLPTWVPGKFPGERREQQHRRLLGLCYLDGLMQVEVFTEKDIEKGGYSDFLII